MATEIVNIRHDSQTMLRQLRRETDGETGFVLETHLVERGSVRDLSALN